VEEKYKKHNEVPFPSIEYPPLFFLAECSRRRVVGDATDPSGPSCHRLLPVDDDGSGGTRTRQT